MKTSGPKFSLTLGIKLLIGVAIASNCFIGLLFYINNKANKQIDGMVNEVLTIREQLGNNLRETIFKLQTDFTELPSFFETDPKKDLINQITSEYRPVKTWQVQGREQYGPLFTRTQKRDISKGRVVVNIKEGRLLLAHGLFDDQDNFLSTVELRHLQSSDPETDKENIEYVIQQAYQQQESGADLAAKIAQLNGLVADKGIEAEKTRNEILERVDSIYAMENRMADVKQRTRRISVYAGGLAILGNMLVLFLLTRYVIERPLGRLTNVIADISSGKFPEIPMQDRKDQIGILSSAILLFRQALLDLKQEGTRREKEKAIINELIETMTEEINALDISAKQLAEMSLSLEDLALSTEEKTTNAADLADTTAKHTGEVVQSSSSLRKTTNNINKQMESQTGVIENIHAKVTLSNEKLVELNNSVADIDSIIGTVYEITDQTKILALNATIEAVKAGDLGKGFGVVAHEVKELSLATAAAASEIMNKVETINNLCRTFIESFAAMSQDTETLRQLTTTINNAAGEQHRHTGTIVELAARTSENNNHLNERIQEINGAVQEVLRLSENAHSSSDNISSALAALLHSTTVRLKGIRVPDMDTEKMNHLSRHDEDAVIQPLDRKSPAAAIELSRTPA